MTSSTFDPDDALFPQVTGIFVGPRRAARGGPVTEQSEDGGYTLALMRLLVTGGAGFIGSNFVRYWVEQHPEDHVVAYDVLTYAGNRPNLADVEDAIVFVQGDICDGPLAEKTLRDEGIDTIVHFAAESHNSLAVLNPGLFFRTNVLGTQTLLEAARQVGIARFHHISTCEVYGDLALDTDEVFTRGLALSPPHALQRQQGRGRSCRAGLRRDLRAARSRSPTAPTTTAPTSFPRRSSRCSRRRPSTTRT